MEPPSCWSRTRFPKKELNDAVLRSQNPLTAEILAAAAVISYHLRQRERERAKMACPANLPLTSRPNPYPNHKDSAALSQSSFSAKLHFSSQLSSLPPSPLSLRCNQNLVRRRLGGRTSSVSPTFLVCVAVYSTLSKLIYLDSFIFCFCFDAGKMRAKFLSFTHLFMFGCRLILLGNQISET